MEWFTIEIGAADAAIWEKMVSAEKLANEYEIPIIRIIEGTGGGGSIKSLEKNGYTYVPANPGWDLVNDNLNKGSSNFISNGTSCWIRYFTRFS